MTQPYILPKPSPLTSTLGPLSLNQFIQTVLVGVSGFAGDLVRPNWQADPPKQPDITVDWLAFGINLAAPDANAYVGVNQDGSTTLTRQQLLEVACSIYGPNALENSGLLIDGFQIDQNRFALRNAKMGFAYSEQPQHIPDLINERWYNRMTLSIFLRRQVQRDYPLLTIASASGTIFTSAGYNLPWLVQQ